MSQTKFPVKIPKIIADILSSRGIETESEQIDFLNPDYKALKHDPFLLPDMRAAVLRIQQAKSNNEKVTIYGDYDIDGMTATVILWQSLGEFGLDVEKTENF